MRTHRTTIALIGALIFFETGCNWGQTNPLDPLRCNPACGSGRVCLNGACVPVDRGPDLGPDKGRPEKPDFVCGDKKVTSAEEQCDGTDLGGKTCQTQGFDGGELGCQANCQFDTSKCYTCTPPAVQESCADGWCTIPAGCFLMGSPETETCRYTNNETAHHAFLTHAFEIAAKEVTQAQFQATVGVNPASFKSCGTDCPVEGVSWHYAVYYCNVISAEHAKPLCYDNTGSGKACGSDGDCTGGEVCIKSHCTKYDTAATYQQSSIYDCPGYRLPTEAEWEYAYRAGVKDATYNGAVTSCQDTDAVASAIGWYTGNAAGSTHQDGQLQPNAWGLYDMAGNVFEWAHDWYQADLGAAMAKDPFGPAAATERVIRGGSWYHNARDLRAACRLGRSPNLSFNYLGFRCARTLPK